MNSSFTEASSGEEAYNALIQDLGLENLDEATQENYINRFQSMVFDATVTRAVGEHLNEEQQAKMASLLGEEPTEESIAQALDYLDAHVPNLAQISKEETERIANTLQQSRSDATDTES